jgi:transcriptional regulator with PAS, ATPase and Fis domain
MGTLAENLFESELFGHIKGSFTDAREDRVGKFEAADGGTLFLDEIGNLSLSMQAKLLSVIQNREIVRVGSNKTIPVNIRLICATNCNLNQMVADGLFREDLLYRINTIPIEIPSLRERKEDILVLAEFFLNKFSLKYGKPGVQINQLAREKLNAYHWPGNIRELQHAMERAIILCEDKILRPDDFLLKNTVTNTVEQSVKTLEEMEEVMITNALDQHNGNFSSAANALGITRQTLYNKIKKFDSN